MSIKDFSMEELKQMYPIMTKRVNLNETRHQISSRKHYHSKKDTILVKMTLKRITQGIIPHLSTLKDFNKMDVINAWFVYLKNKSPECKTKNKRTREEKFRNQIAKWIRDLN